MGKYMITGTYTAAGAEGLLADSGTGRRQAVADLLASIGGSLEAFYYMFGSDDVVAIFDAPDDESVAAAAITIGASGMVGAKTTVLLTPEQIDAAIEKSPAYRRPGS